MTTLAGALAALTLGVAACGGGNGENTDKAEPGGANEDTKVGLAYDIGGRGDQSFNDAAAAGLDRAVEDLGIGKPNELEASPDEPDSKKEERLRLLAEGGFNPIIAVGFAYAGPIGKVAKEFPDVNFAIVDDASEDSKGDNISNLTFAEHEGSFLIGAAAALKSEKKNVGFVGGVEVPLIKKFEAGYKAGVEAVDNGIEVQVKYLTQPPNFTGFNDPAKGKTAAEGMFDGGADVVYHAAGGSGSGVFEAAKAAGGKAIGVDSDQAKTADESVRDVIVTSMLKKVDVAVFDFIKSTTEGNVKSGETVYNLKQGGVDYSTTGGQVDDIEDKLEDYKKQIIDGEITVPAE